MFCRLAIAASATITTNTWYIGMEELFRGIDEDGSKYITMSEMHKALRRWEDKITTEEID